MNPAAEIKKILEIYFASRNSTIKVEVEESDIVLKAAYLLQNDFTAITKVCELYGYHFTISVIVNSISVIISNQEI